MATSSKLFSYNDVKNSPSRNGFDLSRRMAFTAKMSEILPVCVIKTFPGDKFKIKTQHFTRTAPVQSAAFVRIREYFDWFYVPYRMLWRSWQSMSTNMTDQPVMAQSFTKSLQVIESMPYMMLQSLWSSPSAGFLGSASLLNYFGFSRSALWNKLYNYFGYGRAIGCSSTAAGDDQNYNVQYNIPVDIFPIAAYQKIYNDYFRNSQWEMQTPYLWNFDYSNGGSLPLPDVANPYWKSKTMFDMNYCNVPKDLFFGILPASQLGDVAEAPVVVGGSIEGDTVSGTITIPSLNVMGQASSGSKQLVLSSPLAGASNTYGVASVDNQPLTAGGSINTQQKTGVPVTLQSTGESSGLTAALSILAFRQAEYLQKYKEIAQSGDQSYRDQIYKIWGVSLPDDLSDTCRWISGDSSNIDISEVVNTNFSDAYNDDGTPVTQAWIKGKGVGVGEDTFDFSCKEHGVILCLYHTMPILDYDISGVDLQLTQVDWSDYPNPAFDKIGMEALPSYALSETLHVESYSGVPELGYVPRYVSAKTAIDRVVGGFSFGLNDWVAPINDDYFSAFFGTGGSFEINYNFFKASPKLLDSIFGVESDSFVESDQFRVNAFFDIKAVRNFDYNGLPY